MNGYRFNPKRFLEACRCVAVLVLLAFLLGLTADGPPWFVLIGTFCIGVAVAEGLTALADIAIHRRNNAPTNQRKAP